MKTAPVVAIDYNKYMYMGGCNQANSLRASNNAYLTHKKRWYMSLLYFGIDVLLVNALTYNNATHSNTQLTHKAFRLRVIQLFAACSLNCHRSVTAEERGPRKSCNLDTLWPEHQFPGPLLITKLIEGQRMCIWCYHNTKKIAVRPIIVHVCTTCRLFFFCLFIWPQPCTSVL